MARRARARSSPEPSLEPDAASSANEAASSADETSSDEEQIEVEPNLATRSRRSNAGARMQALIEDEASAKIETDEMFKEEENDEEFEQKEEKDEFDSDFGSTDEDAGDDEDDEDAGEKRLQREAKEAKKAARTKKKRGFQAPVHPFARQTKAARKKAAAAAAVASTSATTLDGEGEEGGEEPPKKKKKVALDPAIYAPQRESTRRTAVESRRQVQERLKETEQRKAVAPKQTKKATRTLTQADLIAEALETEEKNRAALLAFYAAEEDRREAERIAGMRYEIIGPKLTFLSRVQGRVDKGKGKEGEKMEKGRKRLIEVIGESGQKGWKAGTAETGGLVSGPSGSTRSNAAAKPSSSASLNGILNPIGADSITSAPPESQEYCRNWLIFDQFEGSRGEELEALFGDHVDWTKPPPVPKNGTKHTLCPITGLVARYRDPRTFTPYGTLSAFRTLNAIVDHQAFIWSDSLSAYTGTTGFGLMRDVEKSWSKRPLPPGSRLMYAVATPPPVTSAQSKGKARASGQGYSQQQRAQVENPYKIEYAHAGGSGRGQRGRSSLPADPAAQYPAQTALPPPPGGAQLPPLPPAPAPAYPAQPPATSQPPFGSLNGQASYAPHAMVGTSQAPQARSIQLGNGKSPFGPPQGQQSGFTGGALPPLPAGGAAAFPPGLGQ